MVHIYTPFRLASMRAVANRWESRLLRATAQPRTSRIRQVHVKYFRHQQVHLTGCSICGCTAKSTMCTEPTEFGAFSRVQIETACDFQRI